MYHSTLPPELEKHYIYTPDGGHSINCLLAEHASEAFTTHSVREHLVPCPVRAVRSKILALNSPDASPEEMPRANVVDMWCWAQSHTRPVRNLLFAERADLQAKPD